MLVSMLKGAPDSLNPFVGLCMLCLTLFNFFLISHLSLLHRHPYSLHRFNLIFKTGKCERLLEGVLKKSGFEKR